VALPKGFCSQALLQAVLVILPHPSHFISGILFLQANENELVCNYWVGILSVSDNALRKGHNFAHDIDCQYKHILSTKK